MTPSRKGIRRGRRGGIGAWWAALRRAVIVRTGWSLPRIPRPGRPRRTKTARRTRRRGRSGTSASRPVARLVRPVAWMARLLAGMARLPGRIARTVGLLAGVPAKLRRRRLSLRADLDLVRRSGRRAAVVIVGLAVVAMVGGATLHWTRTHAPTPARTAAAAGVRTLPVLPALPETFDGVTLETYLQAWVPYEERDALLRSSVLVDPEFARRVHWWIDYWTGPGAAWFPGFLERMAWLGGSVDSALAVHDFPPSLRYLPLIESGYAPGVTSRASAVGLWQLMAPTARSLGLEVSPLVDERRHVRRSTEAALTYLASLQEEFGSWHLTLAAYNSGPTRVRRILRTHAPDAPRTDSLYWALRHQFFPETRDFLPKLYSAMWVASRPEAYGFERPTADPLAFDTVVVPDQTTLDVVARAAGTSHAEVLRLNPHMVRGITPSARPSTLLVPSGHAAEFALHFPLIPPGERVSFVEHVVSPGETLSRIALRYGVMTRDIEAANPEVEAARLRVGARLTVPVAVAAGQSGS